MALQLDVITEILQWLRQSSGATLLHDRVRMFARGSACHSPDLATAAEPTTLPREGYIVIADVAPKALTAPLANATTGLVDAGLPGVFAFMLDEIWTLAELVRARFGEAYGVLDDGWAWSIRPGRGRGWPPHRGGGPQLFDRGAPELVTVWVALADVAADQACMHVVPLDEDPGYPNELERTDAPLETVRALPVSEGAAIAWNANLLHWGGACAATAPAPRVSCSFSLGLVSKKTVANLGFLDPAGLDAHRRLDMIADQIAMYGDGQPDVVPEILQWARIHRQLRGTRKEG
jgi:hypothetical protein